MVEMTEKGKERQTVASDGVDERRRGLLKKAASLAGVVGLAGLAELAATTEAAACKTYCICISRTSRGTAMTRRCKRH
jgi:hypothetical protein